MEEVKFSTLGYVRASLDTTQKQELDAPFCVMLAGIPSLTATQELFLLRGFMSPLVNMLVIWAIKRAKLFYPLIPPILYVVSEKFRTSHDKG